MIICNDIMAYMFGFFFGKTPLIKLSPKKTWEGFIGGAFSTVLFGALVCDQKTYCNCSLHLHGWKYTHIYTEIRKIEMCIRRSPYFDNFQIKKNKIKLFWFRSAIWSDPYTRPLADLCFLKLMHAHALPKVVKIVVNWRDPCFIHLRSPEQLKKNAVFVRGLRAFRRPWQKCEKQMELEVDSGGGRGRSTVSTLMSKVRWAEGCN